MAFPADLQTVTVTVGPYYLPDGSTTGGVVYVAPEWPLVHAPTGLTVLAEPVAVKVDYATGLGSVVLPATDAAGLTRSNFRYTVSERIGGRPGASFRVQFPAASPAVRLADAVPVTGPDGVSVSVSAVTSWNGRTGAVVVDADDIPDGTGAVIMSAAERAKLGGVATGATVNASDAALRDRGTHTGTQSADTITDGTTNRVFTAADEALLDGATSAATGNTLVRRSGGGSATFGNVDITAATPTANEHATRLDWVKANGSLTPAAFVSPLGTTAPSLAVTQFPSTRVWVLAGNTTLSALPTTGMPADRAGSITLIIRQPATGGPFTFAWPGNMLWLTPVPTMPTGAGASMRVELVWTGVEWLGLAPEADLAGATDANTANALARRSATGQATFQQVNISATAPTNTTHATRKDYVDALGTETATPSTVVRRDVNGTGKFVNVTAQNAPGTADTLTRKDYVDANGSLAPAQDGTWATATINMSSWAAPLVNLRTLTMNHTLTGLPAAPAMGRAGTITLILKQAATGGPYTITWPTIPWAGGAAAPTMPTAANAELIVHLFWTGAAWRGIVAGSFFP